MHTVDVIHMILFRPPLVNIIFSRPLPAYDFDAHIQSDYDT